MKIALIPILLDFKRDGGLCSGKIPLGEIAIIEDHAPGNAPGNRDSGTANRCRESATLDVCCDTRDGIQNTHSGSLRQFRLWEERFHAASLAGRPHLPAGAHPRLGLFLCAPVRQPDQTYTGLHGEKT